MKNAINVKHIANSLEDIFLSGHYAMLPRNKQNKKETRKHTLAVTFPAKTCLKEKYDQLYIKIYSKPSEAFDSGTELTNCYL